MFWKRLFERRSLPTWTTSQSLEDFTALTVPAVFACVQVLSQDLARTPTRLRRRVGEDSDIDAIEHDLFDILYALPNPEQSRPSDRRRPAGRGPSRSAPRQSNYCGRVEGTSAS